MNILILSGSAKKDDETNVVLGQLAQRLRASPALIEVDWIDLSGKKIGIGHCGYCGKCKSIAGGGCIFDHTDASLIRKVHRSDVLIVGTPAYPWGVSSQMEMVVKKLYAEAVELQKRRRSLLLITSGTETQGLDDYFRFAAEHLRWNYLGLASSAASSLDELVSLSACGQQPAG